MACLMMMMMMTMTVTVTVVVVVVMMICVGFILCAEEFARFTFDGDAAWCKSPA